MFKKRLVSIGVLSIVIVSLFLVSDIAEINNFTEGGIVDKIPTNYSWLNEGGESELESQSITDPIFGTPTFNAQQEYDLINGFGFWNESATIENTALLNSIKIANDLDNNAHIFWSAKIDDAWRLYHIINFVENSSWSTIEYLDVTVSSSLDLMDVATDSLGRIHLVYTSATLIKYKLYANGEWIVENEVGAGQRPNLELNKNDEPRIVFMLPTGYYSLTWFYSEYSEIRQEWVKEVIPFYNYYWSTNYINYDFMITQENGKDKVYLFVGMVIETGNYYGRDYYVEYDLYKRDNATYGFYHYGYNRLYSIPGPLYYLSKPLIVRGLENEFHLVYQRPIDNYNFELRYHKRGATGWGSNIVLSTNLSLKCDITAKVDEAGRFIVFWNNQYYIGGVIQVAGLRMKVYSQSKKSWSGESLLYDDHGYVQLNIMALDLSGNIHLTWIDKIDNNRTIHYNIGWTDSDEDDLIDKDEILIYGTDPGNPDTDGDQLLDGEEIEYGFDPFDPDEDTDGMHDGYEFHNGLDPYTNDSYLDLDLDMLLNIEEFWANSLPNTNDSDLDTVSDYDEVKTYFTNPIDDDSDDDLVPDGVEIFDLGSNPNLNDTDSDGMDDRYEWIWGLLINVNDSYDDPDLDGLINLLEYENGIKPNDPDTDDDTLNDYDEVVVWGTHPITYDTDGDYIWDGHEVHLYGTHPMMLDTDSDYINDGDEIRGYYKPTNPAANVTGYVPGQINGGLNATNNDTDGDLMIDGFELYYDLHPLNGTDWPYDYDGDGLTNLEEAGLLTDPYSTDTDGDTLLDNEELIYGSDPARYDTDGDGLSDYVEIIVLKTNVTNPDTDYDGLSDYLEVHVYSSDPKEQDSDGDTLLDGDEVNIHGSDPTLKDTDEDKLDDNLEVDFNSSPVTKDTEADGMEDYFEWLYGLDPLVDDSLDDPDNDLITNGEEFIYKSNPLNNDTDSDKLSDYDEIRIHYTLAYSNDTDQDFLSDYDEIVHHTLPHDPDSDDDTLLDGIEVFTYGTNATLFDTDGDGVSDGDEIIDGTDPLDANDNIIITRTKIIVITFSSIIGGLILYNFGPQLIIRLRRHDETKWIRQGIIWRRKKSEILMNAANEEQARLAYSNANADGLGEQ
ncbi:MAG: hypothetical protein ACTSO7_03090 [Candidatus Heimdallarchaeota archaeon]